MLLPEALMAGMTNGAKGAGMVTSAAITESGEVSMVTGTTAGAAGATAVAVPILVVGGVVLVQGSLMKMEGESRGDTNREKAEGDSETTTTNKGNEIDITPNKNHTSTIEKPGVYGDKNSSVDILDENGNIKTRRWYDENGRAYRDVDMTNHGNPKNHPEWPHEHFWDWSSGRPIRK